MKSILTFIALAVLACAGSSQAKGYHYKTPKIHAYHAAKLHTPHYTSPTHVRGYVKKDGTYVMPHVRTAPNATKVDNWSSKPNVNPYTGKPGTKDPFAPPSSGERSPIVMGGTDDAWLNGSKTCKYGRLAYAA